MRSLVLWVLACTVAFANPAKSVDRPKVLLEEIKLLEDKKRIIVPVKVEAKIQSLMSADVEGHVTKILKPLGSMVKVGDVIMYIENKDPSFTYAAVPVRSPINGVVSQLWISQMTKVIRGDKLFTVINPSTLKLSAELPSNELPFVRPGIEGQFAMDTNAENELKIKITGISPLVDARTGTASAEFEFSSNKKTFPPIGSIGKAVFEIGLGKVILVPESSLVFQDGKPMVRVLKGKDQFSKKSIVLGEQRDSAYVVKSGIESGEKIVIRSSRPLKEGEAIDVDQKKVQ